MNEKHEKIIRAGNGATVLHVCADKPAGSGGESAGTISGTALKETRHFRNMTEFLLLIDRCLDEIGKPQATRKTRGSFEEEETGAEEEPAAYRFAPRIWHTPEEIERLKGQIATFDILFETRYYSTWQGAVFGEDGNRIGDFASDLELIELLKSGRKA